MLEHHFEASVINPVEPTFNYFVHAYVGGPEFCIPKTGQAVLPLPPKKHVNSVAMDGLVTLAPSEYAGDPCTSVCGRVVIMRGPFKPESAFQKQRTFPGVQAEGKGGKGKGNDNTNQKYRHQDSSKTEVHIQGGSTMDEIVYFDGWAEGDAQAENTLEEYVAYRITAARKIDATPVCSTLRLPYYLSFVPPAGIYTKIEAYV